MPACRVLLEHADERHGLRMNWLKHGLQVCCPRRREVLFQDLLVLFVERLVLLSIVLDLALKGLDLLI